MDVAYVSAISALAGSVIGGLTSGFTTWLTQRSQARAGMVAHDLARREDLIRDFIIAASKMYGDAMVNSEPKMPEIVDLYAMVSRMRVLSMPRSVMCADKVMDSIIETYFAPNRTVADLRQIVKSGGGVDPLKDFSEAAREELRGSRRFRRLFSVRGRSACLIGDRQSGVVRRLGFSPDSRKLREENSPPGWSGSPSAAV